MSLPSEASPSMDDREAGASKSGTGQGETPSPPSPVVKKAVLIIVTVVGLMGLAWLADHYLPAAQTGEVKTAGGALAPNVTFRGMDGNDVTLAQFKGKVVLVNFWATWCEPCKIEIPWLIEYQQKYASRGFTVLGVAMDEEGKQVVEPWVQKERFDVNGQQLPINYPIFVGNDPLAEQFGGYIGLPFSVLISRDGKVVKKQLGMILDKDKFAKEIESLF